MFRSGVVLYQLGRVPIVGNGAHFSTSTWLGKEKFDLVVCGGGAGGAAISSRFARKFGKGKVAVIEPSEDHYYQPMWTMIGGGMKKFEESRRSMDWVLHPDVHRFRDSVAEFSPTTNTVTTKGGKEISYDFLVVAVGLELRFDLIKGLPEAFETPGVCSNYSPLYVHKTLKALENFQSGNAIFSFPNTPIKCAGAPQKICYITDAYLRKHGKRDQAKIIYNTALPVIFGIKKYAESLRKVAKDRNVEVNTRHVLTEVKPDSKEAVFDILDENGKPKEQKSFKYEMLHVGAPCSAHEVMRKDKNITNDAGFLTVNRETLQHTKYPNIFGIGDCTDVPTAKTAAAVSAQSRVLTGNLLATKAGKQLPFKYNGYTSCPLVTGYDKCILAEFDFDGQPLETFPFDQGIERRSMFHMKKDMMPPLYWHMLVKGYWGGPDFTRKALHAGFSR